MEESAGELTAHITTGAVIVYAIEALKSAGWCRWVTADSTTMNRFISGIAAAGMAFGISATGDAATGWTIHVPMLAVLVAGGWEWLQQFTLQQVLFDGVIKRRTLVITTGSPATTAHEATVS